MTESSALPPADFRLLTPGNWYVLDLNPVTRTASIARLVEDRFGATDDPRLVQARRELTALLRGAARDAADAGAVYAALMDALVDNTALSASLVAVIGPAPVDEDGNVVTDPAALSATLLAAELAAAVETAPLDGTSPTDPDALPSVDLTDAVAAQPGRIGAAGPPSANGPARPDDSGAATGTAQPEPDEAIGTTEIVELPAGPAVRLRRHTDSGLAGTSGETAKAAETQYFIPIPATDRMLVLTFATPNLGFRVEFEELFDRMAETLQWQWEPV
jgi:hypothetical protein